LKEKKTNIGIRIPTELKEQFYVLLEKNEETASQILRRCIKKYIEKKSKK
jgi:predicted DNA-binding protein